MGGHRVDDRVRLAVLAQQVDADLQVRALQLPVHRLADVMHEGGADGCACVEAELARHHTGDVGDFLRMRQDVLAVAGPELQPAHHAAYLWMQVVDPELERRGFALLERRLVDLRPDLLDHFLDAGGMNAAVGDKLFDGPLGDLPAVGVEAGEDDRPWGIVDDQLDPGRGLQGTDVATLASDDAALQVVARQVDHRNRGLDGVVGGAALDRLCDDVLRLVGGCLARFVLQPLDQVGGIAPRVRFELSDKQVLCLVGGHAGDALELGLGLLGQLLATRLLRLGRRFALENGIFASPELPRCPIHSRAAFGECTLAVVQLAFERSQLLAALARMILGLVPEGF